MRASKDDPLLFKQAHEFVCLYTTMADVKTANEAQVSDSEYIWSNSKNLQLDCYPEALYFNARTNLHYGKYADESWSEEGNNCLIKWNPIRRLVEIPLYK
jgi:hypothetical protein